MCCWIVAMSTSTLSLLLQTLFSSCHRLHLRLLPPLSSATVPSLFCRLITTVITHKHQNHPVCKQWSEGNYELNA
ncbi:hypothetical protein M8C21_003619 [Ambrosia artemisiifolia]|uniref:Secreted protein n=1 Tax=Ambrosia artemisiifolia TaxID=4212 RepID=A0AAD5DA89_AMBAR|nr:hypothetical protein M8C21_003619 [Ambrosia artemisiifolia]